MCAAVVCGPGVHRAYLIIKTTSVLLLVVVHSIEKCTYPVQWPRFSLATITWVIFGVATCESERGCGVRKPMPRLPGDEYTCEQEVRLRAWDALEGFDQEKSIGSVHSSWQVPPASPPLPHVTARSANKKSSGGGRGRGKDPTHIYTDGRRTDGVELTSDDPRLVYHAALAATEDGDTGNVIIFERGIVLLAENERCRHDFQTSPNFPRAGVILVAIDAVDKNSSIGDGSLTRPGRIHHWGPRKSGIELFHRRLPRFRR